MIIMSLYTPDTFISPDPLSLPVVVILETISSTAIFVTISSKVHDQVEQIPFETKQKWILPKIVG